MFVLCLGALAGLLVVGALIDVDCRRLPNWLTSAVAALYGLFVVVSPVPVDWMSAVVVAALVFAGGFACFAFGLMGGGDVKLIAGLALWSGIDQIALFVTTTGLAGGLLAIVMLTLRRWMASPLFLVLTLHSGALARKVFGPADIVSGSSSAGMTDRDAPVSLPYGVAIAAGGFAVIHALLQL
jgi:prepilin peptidase CpaA